MHWALCAPVSPHGCSQAERSDGSSSFLQVQPSCPASHFQQTLQSDPFTWEGWDLWRATFSTCLPSVWLLGWSFKDSALSLTVHRSCVSLTYFPDLLLLSCQPGSPGSSSWVDLGLPNEMDSKEGALGDMVFPWKILHSVKLLFSQSVS